MSEVIEELADKAMRHINKSGKIYQTQFAYEKDFRNQFAELIIKECAEICLEANDHKNILRHFGIEE